MKVMKASVTSLAALSIFLEAGIKYYTKDPWIGKLNFFIFMAEGNIQAEHISRKPITLSFITAALTLLIFSLVILNLSKHRVQR